MNCKQTEENLPWLLNGTLPEPEKSMVKEHLAKCRKCQNSKTDTLFLLQSAKTHLPAEALLDYANGLFVNNYEPPLVESHLSVCGECLDELQLIRESLSALDSEVETKPKYPFVLIKSDTHDKTETQPNEAKTIYRPINIWKYAALAAGLFFLLTVTGLIYSLKLLNDSKSALIAQKQELTERITELEKLKKTNTPVVTNTPAETEAEMANLKTKLANVESKLSEKERELQRRQKSKEQTPLTKPQPETLPKQSENAPKQPQPIPTKPQPQANVVALDVFPSSISRDDSSNINSLNIPRNAQSVTLILNSNSTQTFSHYSIELRDTKKRLIWRNNNLRRFSNSDFTINLPANLLPTGSYSMTISGENKGQKTTIETYQINLVRE